MNEIEKKKLLKKTQNKKKANKIMMAKIEKRRK